MNEYRPILSAAECSSMILVSGNISMCGYSRGFLREGASNDSEVVDDDISFGNFGGYFFGSFRDKASIVCSLQTRTNKKAVL